MPKPTRGGRQVNRRPPRRAIARAVRTARTAPLARVRARPTIRGRGVSSASINALRRFAFFPKKMKADGNLDTKWWLEGLKWAGLVTMKLLATLLTKETIDEILRRNPLPMADAGKLPEGSQDTADILLFFDNLLKSMNGSSTKETGKIYRSAVTPRSLYQKLWYKSIPILVLKSMRFVKDNKVTVVPFKNK